MAYTILDCEMEYQKFPRTFVIPTKQEIQALQIGDFVRLIFRMTAPLENGCQGERLWVEITQITGNGFQGLLRSIPKVIMELSEKETICFTANQIATIYAETNLDETKLAMITKYALERREVNWAFYDDDRMDVQDSGWQLFYGGENEEYLDDPENVKLVSLEYVLSFEPRLEKVFLSDGAGYRYDEDKNEFVEDTDEQE